MKVSDFDYFLPKSLIAQTPAEPRDSSRLLVFDRKSGSVFHRIFSDVIDYLNPGDCLVLNNTKVLPARIFGNLTSGGAQVEFLLLKDLGENTWEVMVKPGRKAKKGAEFIFGGGVLKGKVCEVLPSGTRLINFVCEDDFYELLGNIGIMPLPPYIKSRLSSPSRYQTVYAKNEGSVAAPTAGLHFTNELLSKIKQKNVVVASVTLHVGVGTFMPVRVDDVEKHKMHAEFYEVSEECANVINLAKNCGKKVICVGTTSCRTLEATFQRYGKISACSGETDIFIYPGFRFNVIDSLITNFHLPQSTLMMLVSAFAGKESIVDLYKKAVEERYRFFSFGDAMMII